MMLDADLRIAIVGPLSPPAGGMANQTQQLKELLGAEGIRAEVVQVNPPYRPAWIARAQGVRALFRLLPYLLRLWRAAAEVQLFHVMANSGWSWHLFAAPAVWIAKLRGKRVILNYRGGEAEKFFAASFPMVRPTLRAADLIVVSSGFLQMVFAKYGIEAQVIPNIVNLARFTPVRDSGRPTRGDALSLLVARNLEAIYDIPTALRAFALLVKRHPRARLTIAGSGPELAHLVALTRQLGIAGSVSFPGRLNNDEMASLYRDADFMLNPSRVDNMPNSVLEALASAIPVISTNVGGVPFLVEDGKTALLVPPADPQAMANAVERLMEDRGLAAKLVENGLVLVQRYSWPSVRQSWLSAYRSLSGLPGMTIPVRG